MEEIEKPVKELSCKNTYICLNTYLLYHSKNGISKSRTIEE